MRKIIKSTEVEPGKAHAKSYGDVACAIEDRMRGMPKAVWDGNEGRMVPVSYDVQIVQLVDSADYRARDQLAYWAATQMRVRNEYAEPRAKAIATEALNRFTASQRADNGLGVACMTSGEKHLASYEWGKRLRELIEAGKRKAASKEPSVIVDLDWED